MPYFMHDDMPDAALSVIKDNADRVTFCAGLPATYAEAVTAPGSGGKKLADHTIGSSDFTLGDGSTGGRSLIMAAQPDTGDDNGTGDHVAFVDTVNSKLLYAQPASEQPIVAGVAFEFPQIEINVADPKLLA